MGRVGAPWCDIKLRKESPPPRVSGGVDCMVAAGNNPLQSQCARHRRICFLLAVNLGYTKLVFGATYDTTCCSA